MTVIMIDSSADYDIKEKNGFKMMPITVSIGGRDYLDGVDLEKDKFYKLLTKSKEFPKTSQPTPQAFVEVFEEIKAAGDEIVYISLSSELSGTYQSAVIAKQMTDYEGIYIVDSKSATHGIELLADYADKLRAEGVPAAEIAEKLNEVKERIRIVAGVDTLEYLYKGGRLSRGAATVGEITGIKPIIAVREGKVEAIGKTLGKGKAIQFIVKNVSAMERDKDFPVYTVYTLGEENCAELEAKLDGTSYSPDRRLQIGPTIGAHVGPGAYGVIFVERA